MSSFVPTDRFRSVVKDSGLKLEDTDVRYVNEKGDKMKGPLDMNGNKIINVSSPVEDNEVVNKEYLKKIMNNINQNIEQTNKNNKDLSEKIEKTKKDIDQNTKFTQKISDKIDKINDQLPNKNDIAKLKDEIIQNITQNITNIIQPQKQSQIKESLKYNDQKKLHDNLRKASSQSLIPDRYNFIIKQLNPIWREEPFVSEDKKFIYFPGMRSEEEPLNFFYMFPKVCTIFMVVKFFDNIGLVYIEEDGKYIFSLAKLQVFHDKIKKMKPLEQRKKYSIIIEVKHQRIQRIIITNNGILEVERPNIIFNHLRMGKGHGVIYDLIVYDKLLKEETIVEIYKSLNKIHKIYS